MVSTVKSRPNHYEVLGLTPAASGDEIARAFAREVGRPRAFGGIAQVSIAYETLRDPLKRRAYDASLGLGSDPEPPPLDGAAAWRAGSQYFAFAPVRPVMRPVHEEVPPGARETPPPQPEPEVAPRFASPSAAPTLVPIDEWPLDAAGERSGGWTRAGLVVGTLVGSAVLLGALAGSWVGSEPQPPQAEVTSALPPPKPVAVLASPPAASESRPAVAQPRLQRRAVARDLAKPAAPSSPPGAQRSETTQFVDSSPADSQLSNSPAEQATAPLAPPAEVTAAMPLPASVIARTIDRIGYTCGQVASTSAVAGSRGVYTVACTSGASYQATPVRGRYHFRRLGSH